MGADTQMLKASDVAPLLGVTTGRVYQLISTGLLPAVRMGRSIRIPRIAWEKWLKKKSELAEIERDMRRQACA